jgi:tetratricopeptide (TPR) repeat protein
MPTHATKISLLTCAIVLGARVATAQLPGGSSASPPSPSAPAAPAASPAPSAPTGEPATNAAPTAPPSAGASAATDNVSSALDYLFNHKPQDGSAAQAAGVIAGNMGDKMKAADVLDIPPGLDDPVLRQRFEIYLKHPGVSPDRVHDYTNKMNELSEMLKQGKDVFAAWKMLYALSEDQDLDAGISRELANRVEAVWNTVRTNDGLDQKNDKLEHEIDLSDRNADMIAQELRTEEQERAARVGGQEGKKTNPAAPPTPDSGGGTGASAGTGVAGGSGNPGPAYPDVPDSMQLTAEYLRGLEGRAKIKLNEVQQDANIKQAKSDFADYITTLYASHRYNQVIIAAGFYRQLFDEGDYPVAMADQVNASLEANNNAGLAVDDFKDEVGKGEVAGAATMLETAFLGNEFHPALQGIPLEQKKLVSEYLKKLSVLENVIAARDFGRVEGLIAEISKIATDFDSTKPTALINGVKLESTLRLGKAKMLVQQRDLKDAMEEFQSAAEAWPGNPDLRDSANGFFDSEDVKTRSVTEFDRLIQGQNYRELFDRQLVFAPAIHGDAPREDQLKAALEKVQKAEIASDKANALVYSGDVYGAWETLEEAVKGWPDDNKLNRQFADLSGRATDFVAAINKARNAEAKKDMGYSLTWYLNAQHIYPPSVIANDGIDRLSKLLLSSGRDGPSGAN